MYLAELPSTNRLYAIKGIRKDKLIDTDKIQSTFNELSIMLEAQHQNLCGMEYFFQTDSRLYFVMPHIAGGDMYAHLRKYQKFDEVVVKFYITQIVLGIGQLHQRNIIHRDLKLENIMLCENGYIKLIDFGMSRILAPGNDQATTYAGTAEYMAPEMLDRNLDYNHSIDWWAVGILMYELLTGATPFFSQKRSQLNWNIMNGRVPWSRRFSCSAEFKDLVNKLLIKQAGARLGSQGGCAEILQHPWFPQGQDLTMIENQEMPIPVMPDIDDDNLPDEQLAETIIDQRTQNKINQNANEWEKFDMRATPKKQSN